MLLQYDDISPITGEKTVLTEFDEQTGHLMSLCMMSGYHTYDCWFEGSDYIEQYEKSAPEIVKNSKFVDSYNRCWYKLVSVSLAAILYPDFQQDIIFEHTPIWKVAELLHLPDSTEIPEGYVILTIGNNNKIYFDDVNAKVFAEFKYEDATMEFYNLTSKIYITNEN